MDPYSLVYPMAALVALTLTVLLLILISRFGAVLSKKVPASFYRFMQGDKEPERLVAISRNYRNLFEAPILYYAVCLLVITLDRMDINFVYLAWAYVGLRVIHSIIHITYNRVLHRLTVYTASIAILMVMWIRLAFGA